MYNTSKKCCSFNHIVKLEYDVKVFLHQKFIWLAVCEMSVCYLINWMVIRGEIKMHCLEEPKCRMLSLLCEGIWGIQRCQYGMSKCHIQVLVKHEGTILIAWFKKQLKGYLKQFWSNGQITLCLCTVHCCNAPVIWNPCIPLFGP